MQTMMIICVLIHFLRFQESEGSCPLQGLVPGAPCFSARNVSGCNESEPDPRYCSCTPHNMSSTLFLLFTPKNPVHPEFLHECGCRLPNNTNFNPEDRTEIFIHGWIDGTCRSAWMREMKDQLLIRGNYNVILVDWTWGNTPDYKTSVDNLQYVANDISCLIGNVKNQTGVGKENFHLIGQSFGAHIAGFVGQVQPIRRITGLDAALAPFENKPPSQRLDPSDACFVDVIHSGGGNCFPLNLGTMKPLGHADFYPNGGQIQPACVPYIHISLLKFDLLYAAFSTLPNFCNHLQSIQFYKVSINACHCQFIGLKADNYESFLANPEKDCGGDGTNCAVMGMDCEDYWNGTKNTTNKYYLDTGLLCPYCDNSHLNPNGFNGTNSTHCMPY